MCIFVVLRLMIPISRQRPRPRSCFCTSLAFYIIQQGSPVKGGFNLKKNHGRGIRECVNLFQEVPKIYGSEEHENLAHTNTHYVARVLVIGFGLANVNIVLVLFRVWVWVLVLQFWKLNAKTKCDPIVSI